MIEFVRGARIAIIKKSAGFHEKLLEFDNREPSRAIVENEYLDQRDDVLQCKLDFRFTISDLNFNQTISN